MSRIRELSADEETRRLAFVRERALRDEVSFLNDARREGREEGIEEGRQEGEVTGEKRGETLGMANSLRSLIILKFNNVPSWVERRIDAADNDQLKKWTENILKADSLEAVFAH